MINAERQPQAFNTEYREGVSPQRIKDDLFSYIGEYRLRLQKYDYSLVLLDGKLCEPHQFEPMVVAGRRAIEKRTKNELPTHREEAELRGIMSLELDLRSAIDGDTIVGASPPGPKEEGYGDYGFVYAGKVRKNGTRLDLEMTAIRVEKPTLGQFNKFMSRITGANFDFSNPDRFLEILILLYQGISKEELYKIIEREFGVEFDKEEGKLIEMVKKDPVMSSLSDEFVRTRDIKFLHAMENRGIDLKENYKDQNFGKISFLDLRSMIVIYGYQPPKANGSCGVSAQSNRIFGSFSSVSELSGNKSEWFTCPRCRYKADGPIGNTCPGCGITKEQFAKENPAQICA